MSVKRINAVLDAAQIKNINAGDELLISGEIFTARDAAHKRFCDLILKGEKLPLDLKNRIIFFAGPSPAKPQNPVGSIGPTTSGRMDAYSPILIRECGLAAMIGKGNRSKEVVAAMKECGAIYFATIGGAAALLAQTVISCEIVAYEDLGTEAVRKLVVKDFPVIAAIDSKGNSLYEHK